MRQSTVLTAALLLLLAGCQTASAQTMVTLNATADHAGLVRNNGNVVNQYGRDNTLWGTNGGVTQRRNGLIQFESLDAGMQADLASGDLRIASATLELWNTNNAWNETTLLFARVADADADWAALNGPDDGTNNGVSSWNNKNQVADPAVDWASGNGEGGGYTGAQQNTAGQQVFGSLTSSNPSGTTTGDTKFTVPLFGTELADWLSNPSVAPSLVVYWDDTAGDASPAQTRFATINTADTDDEFAPNLVLEFFDENTAFGDVQIDGVRDGIVDQADFFEIAANFGNTGTGTIDGDALGAPDGVVDFFDYAVWKQAPKTGGSAAGLSSAAAVPEPSALLTLALASLGLACIVRRK